MKKIILILVVLVAFAMVFMLTPVSAKGGGATKIDMRDQTQNGIGATDPYIGFVIYNQNGAGTLVIQVSLKGVVPNALLEVQLVLAGADPCGGIIPEPGGHFGTIHVLGYITTNGAGNGNAHFNVDPESLIYKVPGVTNYGHIDCEDDSGAISTGILDYGLVDNQYGGTALQWEQP